MPLSLGEICYVLQKEELVKPSPEATQGPCSPNPKPLQIDVSRTWRSSFARRFPPFRIPRHALCSVTYMGVLSFFYMSGTVWDTWAKKIIFSFSPGAYNKKGSNIFIQDHFCLKNTFGPITYFNILELEKIANVHFSSAPLLYR